MGRRSTSRSWRPRPSCRLLSKSLLYRPATLTNVFVSNGLRHVRLHSHLGRRSSDASVHPERQVKATGRPAVTSPAGHCCRTAVIAYIIRRDRWRIVLLLMVSAVTFAIFFLVPRLAGATTDDLATRYVGRTPTPAIHAAEQARLPTCCSVQYWHFVKGIVVGANYNFGPATGTARRPASATPSRTRRRCGRTCSTGSRSPSRSRSARPCSGWSPVSAIGVHLRAQAGPSSTARPWASRWPASRCRSSSPACCCWRIFSYQLGDHRARRSYMSIRRRTRSLGVQPDPALGRPGLPVRRAVRPAHPGGHAGDHGRGLHPHRPRQGPARAHRGRQARAARRAHPDRDDLRPRLRPADRRRGPHREVFSLPGIGKYAVDAVATTTCPRSSGSRWSAAFFVVLATCWWTSLYAVARPAV